MRTVRIHIQESIIDHILVNSSDISHPLEYGYPDYEIHSSMQGFSDSERLMEHLLFLVISMLPADLGTIWSWDSRTSIPWTLPVVKSCKKFPHFKSQGSLLRLSRVISRASPNQRCHVLRRKLICPQSPFKAHYRQCCFLSMPKRHRAQTLSPRMSRHRSLNPFTCTSFFSPSRRIASMDQYFHDQRFDSSSVAQLWLLASALPQVFLLKSRLASQITLFGEISI